VIPRGVDRAAFDPAAVPAEALVRLTEAWTLPDKARVVMLPGRLTGWKGQAVLLDAIARLNRADVVCVLVGAQQGGSRYAERLYHQAETLGIADRLRLVGHCDEMPVALLLADVVVHASTEPEAFGRVVIEAQAMGRPVIASDLGGPVETVRHGVTGWRVPPNDPAALAAAIAQVLDMHEGALRALGERARDSVPTLQAMQAATLAVYREVLNRRGRSPDGS
jgi:glycosyltransferase involved in cell wall biosynthesis